MFSVDIWGGVAAWVGAVGTSGAALAAAVYYISDRHRESTSQSRAINYLREGTTYVITNASDQPIYQIRLLYDPPKTFGDALAANSHVYGVKYWDRDKEPFKEWTDQAIYDSFRAVQRYRYLEKWDKLLPGDSVTISPKQLGRQLISLTPYCAFADVRGRHWDLYLGDDKPKKHNKGKVKLRTRVATYRIRRTNRLRARWRARQIARNVDKEGSG